MKSSLGGEVYAIGETKDRMLLLKDFYGPFEGMSPGAMGSENCEGFRTHLKKKKQEEMISEKFLVRNFLSIQRALEAGVMGNAYWLPGTENPAEGLTEVRIDVVPPCDFLNRADFVWGSYAPLKARRGRGKECM